MFRCLVRLRTLLTRVAPCGLAAVHWAADPGPRTVMACRRIRHHSPISLAPWSVRRPQSGAVWPSEMAQVIPDERQVLIVTGQRSARLRRSAA